ncbi:MAG: hypothetical protein V1867_05515 [Candidatus Falkowbacteria bacterium]
MSNEKLLTKKDLREELGKFTEEVLVPTFVTKEDLKHFATKEDLFAVKEDLKQFVTKTEFDKKTDRIIDVLDSIVKMQKDHEVERISNLAAHDRFEKRITKLEKCTVTKITGK